jgi:CHAD domain-containing protein
VRIRVKRLRYGCESFAACLARSRDTALPEKAAALQEILGELNDIRVQRGLLARFENPAPSTVIRGAAARLARRERLLAASLGRAWRAFGPVRPYWRQQPVTS